MRTPFTTDFIATDNSAEKATLEADYTALAENLARRNIDIEAIKRQAMDFAVAVPSWGVGSGGTRFARFPGIAEPRNIFEKLDDCAVINQLSQATPAVSPHFPWDVVDDMSEVKAYSEALGLGWDAINSNTFQDQAGQALSYKYGSLTHTDPAVRDQAIQAQPGLH